MQLTVSMETELTMNKNKTIFKRSILLLVLASVFVTLDQWTKMLAVTHLKNQPSIVLIPGVFELKYLENTGAAFGILSNQQTFFYIATILMAAGIIYLYFKTPDNAYYRPVNMIYIIVIAGAVGNFIDRVSYKYVIDFFYFSLINFPIFNVADIYVTVGVAVLMLLIIFKYDENDFDFLFKKKEANT